MKRVDKGTTQAAQHGILLPFCKAVFAVSPAHAIHLFGKQSLRGSPNLFINFLYFTISVFFDTTINQGCFLHEIAPPLRYIYCYFNIIRKKRHAYILAFFLHLHKTALYPPVYAVFQTTKAAAIFSSAAFVSFRYLIISPSLIANYSATYRAFSCHHFLNHASESRAHHQPYLSIAAFASLQYFIPFFS